MQIGIDLYEKEIEISKRGRAHLSPRAIPVTKFFPPKFVFPAKHQIYGPSGFTRVLGKWHDGKYREFLYKNIK